MIRNVLRQAASVASLTMVSRIGGFIRDLVMAMLLGTGVAAEAFLVAWRLPNFFRAVFAEGALHASFVPTLSTILQKRGTRQALHFASQILILLACGTMIVVLVLEIFMDGVIGLLVPGFAAADPGKFSLSVDLARITFPFLIFIACAHLMSGILNCFHRFAAGASLSIILNVTLIGAMIPFLLDPALASGGCGEVDSSCPAYALAWGLIIAGILQCLFMVTVLFRNHLRPRIVAIRWNRDVQGLLRLFGPAFLGMSAHQINLLVATFLASFLPQGSIAYLYYADRITQLPLGVVGIALSTVLLPILATQISAGNHQAARKSLEGSVLWALGISLPAMVGLIWVAQPMMETLFVRGSFTLVSASQSALALQAFTIGLPAYFLVKIFTVAFFAGRDTITPTKITAIILFVNIGANLILMKLFSFVGIALATALSACLHAVILAVLLRWRNVLHIHARFLTQILRIIACVAVMLGILSLLSFWVVDDMVGATLETLILIVGGGASYLLACRLFGVGTWAHIRTISRG